MGLGEVEIEHKKSQFKESSVRDLTERLEVLNHKIQGLFLALEPSAGRHVEVKFMDAVEGEQLTGYVEKWNVEGELWVTVTEDADKPKLKHYRLPPNQNISSRLINLNK